MLTSQHFLGLPPEAPEQADVILLPLPFEGTVSYGKGTANGPEAIWRASGQVELWDEELDFSLDSLKYYSAPPLEPHTEEPCEKYLGRVLDKACRMHGHGALVVGVGGEHSITPPLVKAALEGYRDPAGLTVVQIDAHADLRNMWDGSRNSHACAMRRVVELGSRVIAIGIRSADRDEAQFGRECGLVNTFGARGLAMDPGEESRLLETLDGLRGDVYLTVDIDGLEVALCPGTGTPQPGGLHWWQMMRYMRRLLYKNDRINLIGFDVCETVPTASTQINEVAAANVITKVLAYQFAAKAGR